MVNLLLKSIISTVIHILQTITKVGTSFEGIACHWIWVSYSCAYTTSSIYTSSTSCFMPNQLYCICHISLSTAHTQKPTADPISRTPGNANPRGGLNRAIHDRPPGLKKGMISRRLNDAPDIHAKKQIM